MAGVDVAGPAAVGPVLGRDATGSANTEAASRIATGLGATWFVTGGYQRVGDQLRMTIRLVEVATGAVVYAGTVDGALDELFVLQDRVVEMFAAELRTAAATSPPATAVVERTPAGLAAPTSIIDGPPPPVPPATIARDTAGRATLRAVRVTEPVRIDGALDERAYQDVRPVSGFIQVNPLEGEPATEETEIWVLFDGDNLYVSGRCHDSAPESDWVANEMRRDGGGLASSSASCSTPLRPPQRGRARRQPARRPDGWPDHQRARLERRLEPGLGRARGALRGRVDVRGGDPFKSLRYRPGQLQTWGFQVERLVAWKNEHSTLTPLPAAWGMMAAMQISQAATLVDLRCRRRSQPRGQAVRHR